MKKEVDFNIFKAQILDDIKAGKPLFGKDGALAPMIENLVNAVLEGSNEASRSLGVVTVMSPTGV